MSEREPFDGRKDSNTCHIYEYFHCALCLNDLPEGMSIAEHSKLEVGGTKWGIQVWCLRHKVNVYHFDLLDNSIHCDKTRAVLDENPDWTHERNIKNET